jgi:hypothetical protein
VGELRRFADDDSQRVAQVAKGALADWEAEQRRRHGEAEQRAAQERERQEQVWQAAQERQRQERAWQAPYTHAAPIDGLAIVALAIAIISLLLAGIPSIVSLLMANNAQRKIKASGGRTRGLGLAKAAKIISIIGIVIFALFVVTQIT